MKELFRHSDATTVGYYKSQLDAAGIPVVIRNSNPAMTGMGTIPPQHFPNICVTNDEDYARAREILQKAMFEDAEQAEEEVACPSCAERNPGNFEICFACQTPLQVTGKDRVD